MRDFENQLAAAVRRGEIIDYWAIPIYQGSHPIPVGVTLLGRGSGGFSLGISIVNRGRQVSSLKDLMSLLPPPPEAIESEDAVAWGRVERFLGTELPLEYKELLATYGSGAVDGFLWILNPFSKNRYLNLIDEGLVKLEALAALIDETVPYSLYPVPNGLLPCAVTDNGDVIFWICSGHPSEWNLAINEGRGPRWREYKLSLTDFLIQLISRKLIVDIFPPDFPSNEPVFFQYKVASK